MLEKYKKEIHKNKKSTKMFEDFKDNVVDYGIKISQEEAFIGYYRAMQMWIFNDSKTEKEILKCSMKLGKIKTIKIIQKILGLKKDGVIGPVTRDKIKYFNLEDFKKEIKKPQYILIKILRLWR